MAIALKNEEWKTPWTFTSRPVDEPLTSTGETSEIVLETDEDTLVRQAQAGESEAYEQLYSTHVRRIYALCLRMLSDPQRAEEMTQDVFVRAWETIQSFEFRSAFGTWLHRLGVNVVLGSLRTDKRREKRVSAVDNLAAFERETKEAMPETKVDLERAIAALPRGAKEVLILHDIEGYRYREIAEMIGTAEGTVKSQLSRARRLVREELIK